MIEREKLQTAIVQAISPFANEEIQEEGGEDDDPFIHETATFLAQELIDSKIEITDDQADLHDEDLENLPITQILSPHIIQLLAPSDPLNIISTIIQIYTAPDPDPETHPRLRNGPCEVHPSRNSLMRQLCERVMPLTFHHLIPRSTHRQLLKRHVFSRAEMTTRGASICRACHSAIHRMYDNKTLALELNTVDKLLAQEKVQRFCEWKSKQRVRVV